MKGREKMNNLIATLEIVRYVSAIALCVALAIYGLYRNIKETAEDTVREELEQAMKETAKPVVKIEIQTKGKW